MSVRIGLIGAGRMGSLLAYHLAYTVDQADFVAVADAHVDSARHVAQKFGVPDVYEDYQQLLERADIDAVVIVTPTHTHADVIQDAAAAGKHIFTEKPLALTLEACDVALQAVEDAGVKMQVGFMRRFDPAHVVAKQKINEGVIGMPAVFKSIGRDVGAPNLDFARRENSGGLIMDMGIHDFDLARWLMESEVKQVSSSGSCFLLPELKDSGDIDIAVVNLLFDNGAVGNVEVTRASVHGYDIRTEVFGSEGSVMIGQLQHTPTLVLTANNVSHDVYPGFLDRFADAYEAEMRGFIKVIEADLPPPVTGKDARAATAIGIAATMSLDEDRPVQLSEIEQATTRLPIKKEKTHDETTELH